MLTIRDEQLSVLRDVQRARFLDDAVRRLAAAWPHRLAAHGEPALRATVTRAIDDALALGLTESVDLLRYANIAVALGAGFASDPNLPWAAAIIRSNLPPLTRLQLLHDETARELASRPPS